MKNNRGRFALIVAALAGLVAGPQAAPTAPTGVQAGQETSAPNQRQPAPTPPQRANLRKLLHEAIAMGGFEIAATHKEPIWIGRPRQARGSAGFPFKRNRRQRWA